MKEDRAVAEAFTTSSTSIGPLQSQWAVPAVSSVLLCGSLFGSVFTEVRDPWEPIPTSPGIQSFVGPPTGQDLSAVGIGASGETAEQSAPSPAKAVHELRKLSGLTWEKLADLFGVSRRSVHAWGSGATPTADNEERIFRTLAVVRAVSRGSAAGNRALLFSSVGDGSGFELLKSCDFSGALEVMGGGALDHHARPRPRVSPTSVSLRLPPPPHTLLEADHPGDMLAGNPAKSIKVGKARGQSG